MQVCVRVCTRGSINGVGVGVHLCRCVGVDERVTVYVCKCVGTCVQVLMYVWQCICARV